MAIQFGLADMTLGGVTIGCLQNMTVDFTFDVAELFCGSSYYPKDVRVHTGRINGSAEFAELTAQAFQKLLGGTLGNTQISLTKDDAPSTFQLVSSMTTDSVTFTITFLKVRSTQLSLPFVRDGHLIPNFNFSCEADDSGNVATIDVGDLS